MFGSFASPFPRIVKSWPAAVVTSLVVCAMNSSIFVTDIVGPVMIFLSSAVFGDVWCTAGVTKLRNRGPVGIV